VRTLIVVGALNGLVLPVSLGVILLAAHRRRLMPEGYTHPRWLTAAGTIVALAMAAMGAYSMATDLPKLWRG
jgi:Mn2+/Fe2+ NRAMP family transporter